MGQRVSKKRLRKIIGERSGWKSDPKGIWKYVRRDRYNGSKRSRKNG